LKNNYMKKNNISKFLLNHWDELIIVILTITSLCILFIPFISQNSLDKYDHPGLLSLSWFIREYILPNFQGWNPYFFAGFPQGTLYPPLFHYLVALLGKVFHPSIAYKLVITSASVFIPYTIYEFSLKIYKEKPWALLNTILLMLTLIILPGYLGFNYDGLFDYGLGPNFVTIPLFFIYLRFLFSNKPNIKSLAIVFSIMLLTNLVAPFVSAVITLTYLLLSRKNTKIRNTILKHALLSFFLTLFWTIPFIVFYKYSASGYPMKVSKMISILPVLLSFLAIFYISLKSNRENKFFSILIPGFLISVLASIDSFANTETTKFSIPPIHPYRLIIFSYIGIALSFVYMIKNLHPIFHRIANKFKISHFFKPRVHISMMISLFTILLGISMYLRLNPEGAPKIELKQNYEWDGRIIRAYKVSDVLDQSRAVIDKSVIINPDLFAVDGLLKESSYIAPYYQSLSKNLHQDDFDWQNLDNYYIENIKISETKTKYLSNLLWVKSVFTIDENFPCCEDFELISTFKSNSKDEGIVDRSMYICNYSPAKYSNFAEMLTYKPDKKAQNWDDEVENWWESEETNIFTDKEINNFNESSINYIPEVEFSENYQSIRIRTNVEEELYYLVKMSFFPKWRAYDKYNKEIEIYRASPNFMIVPINDEVTLRYEITRVEWLSLYISLITWFSIIIFPVAYKIKQLKIYR